MSRLALGLIFATLAALTLAGLASAQPKPEFKLGFKALADQILEVVGEPLENEHWGDNGDSLQQTTRGLMVWRKADNWTAFSNGDRTWINGPRGIQERANDDRFSWEAQPSTATATQPQSPEVVLYQESFDRGMAPGWELESGWVAAEGSLLGQEHRWARLRDGPWQDFRVQLRLNLIRGGIHLNYRTSGPIRYFVGFTQQGLYLSKQTGQSTFMNNLAKASTPYPLNSWQQVEIAGQGGRLQVRVNGKLEIDYTDPDPLTSGGIAFETLEGAVAHVDDVMVYGPTDPGLTWIRTGGPPGGLGYDVRMLPDNPDVMYVTDAFAGVFMSTDGGRSWTPTNAGIASRGGDTGDAIPVFSLTIDPNNHNVLWIGMQNARGIYKSTDGGRTWSERVNGIVERRGISFRGFAVDPRSSDIVYAAAEVSSWEWAGEERKGREFDLTKGVVYKTTDGGANWSAAWRGDNLARYVWIDPRDPKVVYVSTGIFDREAANSDPGSGYPGGVGVVKSTDGGRSWTPANRGLANLYVGTLFLHPTNPDILIAGTGNNQYSDGAGVYLSTDGGDSWRQTLAGDKITSVEISPSEPDIAYAGSSNAVYRSEDGGRTWERVSGGRDGWGSPGVRAGFPIDFQVDPRDPDRIFANEYGGGNFLSTDGGRTWREASKGYSGAQVRDIAADPTAAGRILAAARSGIFASENGGHDWAGLSYPPAVSLEWYVVAVDPVDSRQVLAANNWDRAVLRSEDGGRSWLRADQPPLRPGVSWRALAFAPSDPATVYAGTAAFFSAGTFDNRMPAAGIYLSGDGGRSWRPTNDATSAEAHVTGLAVDPRDPRVVFAATGNLGMLRSADGGQSWVAINPRLPGSPRALAVALHPDDPGVIYLGLERAGLYRSEDGGQTWRPSASGMNPEASVTHILFDPMNPRVMYAADRLSGVYRSSDGGATWRSVNAGLRNRAVNALAISAEGGHLYGATEGGGVFRLDLKGNPPAGATAR